MHRELNLKPPKALPDRPNCSSNKARIAMCNAIAVQLKLQLARLLGLSGKKRVGDPTFNIDGIVGHDQ